MPVVELCDTFYGSGQTGRSPGLHANWRDAKPNEPEKLFHISALDVRRSRIERAGYGASGGRISSRAVMVSMESAVETRIAVEALSTFAS